MPRSSRSAVLVDRDATTVQAMSDDEAEFEIDDDAPAESASLPAGAVDARSEPVFPETGLTVEPRAHGWRIDQYLVRLYPNFSRALFQKAIADGGVKVNGLPVKMSRRLRVNDRVDVRLPERPDESLAPENIPLEVLFEDQHLVVINKPAGLITHPGKGNYGGTLANALQFHFDALSDVAGRFRPGIVHRLDRDTSGVIVVAKNNQVHGHLSAQFERRETRKEYRAIAWGRVANDAGIIETHMRVHPGNREKMTVCEPGGNSREATTGYEVLERFAEFTYVRMLPKTGRTHQIRVHLRHLGIRSWPTASTAAANVSRPHSWIGERPAGVPGRRRRSFRRAMRNFPPTRSSAGKRCTRFGWSSSTRPPVAR